MSLYRLDERLRHSLDKQHAYLHIEQKSNALIVS